jgi:transposase
LTPAEYSSGEQRRLRGITKTGNRRARRALIESAKSYRYKAKVSEAIRKRQEGVPKTVCDIAWRAQVRLCQRYRTLLAKGKHANTVTTAIAREIAGFMWDIARQVQFGQ